MGSGQTWETSPQSQTFWVDCVKQDDDNEHMAWVADSEHTSGTYSLRNG